MTATLTELDLTAPPEPIVVNVDGRPAPKGSRIAGKTKTGKAYTYPASTYEKGWVAEVSDATRLVMRHRTDAGPPYRVELTFRMHKAKRPVNPWPTAQDLDKLARAVIDGLVRGGAMSDDRHVIALTAEKVYASPEVPTGVTAVIRSEQDIWTSL